MRGQNRRYNIFWGALAKSSLLRIYGNLSVERKKKGGTSWKRLIQTEMKNGRESENL